MKRSILSLICCLSCLLATGQTNVRYWFDRADQVTDSVLTSSGPFEIDVSPLTAGIHTLYLNIDSAIYMNVFHRIPMLNEGLYWIDGNLVAHLENDSVEIDVTELSQGFHILYVNIGNQTSTTLFYRSLKDNEHTCRYWIDQSDTLHDATMNGGVASIDVSSYSVGFHTLNIVANGQMRTALFYRTDTETATTYSLWLNENYDSRQEGMTSEGTVIVDVTELADTLHTAYIIVGHGLTAQVQSYEFEKVPVFYTVTLASADSTRGSVSGAGDYPRNSTVSISATAEYGYHLSQWSDGDTNALRSIYLTQDTSLIAYFVPDTFQLDITVGDTAMGTVVVTGTSEYLGTDTATAVPNYGYHFTGWSDGDTTNPRLVTLTQDTTLTAIFAPNIYTVTLASDTPEWGSVVGGGEYEYLTLVPIEAVAVYGYQFKQWNDGNTDNPRQIVVRGDTSLSATFELRRYQLTVQSNDLSRGFTQGGGTYSVLDTATALAVTLSGNSFLGWSDGATDNPRQLQIWCDSTVTALFEAINDLPDTIVEHDTTMVHDTTYIDVPYPVHDTTVVIDTVTLTEYVPVHDTTYIDVPYPVHDTTVVIDTVTLTEYVPVHDTTYIDVHDTTIVTDTVTLTEYVPVHDTTYITLTDTLTVTEYDTITNTVFDTITNTIFDTVTNTVYDTIDNYIYDTLTVTDTLWLTQYDTIILYDTIYDTIYVTQEGIEGVEMLNVKVYSSQGQVVVEGADGNDVTLFDITGRRIQAIKQSDNQAIIRFDVPASGTYLIRIGNHPARKVVVIR